MCLTRRHSDKLVPFVPLGLVCASRFRLSNGMVLRRLAKVIVLEISSPEKGLIQDYSAKSFVVFSACSEPVPRRQNFPGDKISFHVF